MSVTNNWCPTNLLGLNKLRNNPAEQNWCLTNLLGLNKLSNNPAEQARLPQGLCKPSLNQSQDNVTTLPKSLTQQ